MTAPIRVFHVLDHSIPHRSGYAMRSRSIIDFQRQLGLDPIVVTAPRHYDGSIPRIDQETRETIDGTLYHRLAAAAVPSGLGRAPLLAEWHEVRELGRRIASLASQYRADVIHAHSPSLNGHAALRAGRHTGLPVVYEIRAFWEDAAVDQGKYREGSWKYRLHQWLEGRLARRADHLTVICQGIRRELMRRGVDARKITVTPNGVDYQAFSAPGDDSIRRRYQLEGCTVLGFIGSFYRYEGLQLLVEAVARLKDECPRLRVLLVGSGEVRDELIEQVHSRGLDDRVIFAGSVPHDQVRHYYAAMDVLVYPRLPRRITEFTTPLKPLEAMAQRKLVIGSDVGGIAELIDDRRTGFLFRAGSVAHLAQTLREVIARPDEHEHYRHRAAAAVRDERQWTHVAERYRAVYENVLRSRISSECSRRRGAEPPLEVVPA